MKVICKYDSVPASTNGFHENGVYEIIGRQGNCYIVLNDNGHERVILLDTPSPHIKTAESKHSGGRCCGHFELLENTE